MQKENSYLENVCFYIHIPMRTFVTHPVYNGHLTCISKISGTNTPRNVRKDAIASVALITKFTTRHATRLDWYSIRTQSVCEWRAINQNRPKCVPKISISVPIENATVFDNKTKVLLHLDVNYYVVLYRFGTMCATVLKHNRITVSLYFIQDAPLKLRSAVS